MESQKLREQASLRDWLKHSGLSPTRPRNPAQYGRMSAFELHAVSPVLRGRVARLAMSYSGPTLMGGIRGY